MQIIGRHAAFVFGAGAIIATALALESKTGGNAKVPSVTLDTKALDRASRLPVSFSSIIKKVTPGVVKIETTVRAELVSQFGDGQSLEGFPGIPGLRRFFEQRGGPGGAMRTPREHGAASGVIATSDGYILTNNHVVDHAEKVEVTLNDGRKFSAKVIGVDPKSDLAVIKIEADNLAAIPFADSSATEVGDVVLAVGNPFGLGESVTLGMISAKGRATLGLDYEDFIQTDAAINPGNSGGALVDAEGRLVGVNTAIVSRGGGNDGIGFAIPTNMAHQIMNQLITHGRVTRAYLGAMIQDLTPTLATQFKAPSNTQGALVSDVPNHTPAAKAGLASGDIVTGFDNQPVKDARALKLAVGLRKPGESVAFTVLRDGNPLTLNATLTKQPSAMDAGSGRAEFSENEQSALNGVSFSDLTKEARRELNLPADLKGVLVTGVEPDSAAWEAGLREGDVIEQINRHAASSSEEAMKLAEDP